MQFYRRTMTLGILFICVALPAYGFSLGIFPEEFSSKDMSYESDLVRRSVGKFSSRMLDMRHGVKMGISSDTCDNAKDFLSVDWSGSPLNYTCYHPKNRLPVVEHVTAVEECSIPDNYYAKHVCMDEKIAYDVQIPTYGNHRPLWPIYGEYIFVPPQRWLHSLEHGAVVMLYHPCTEPYEVEKLKKLVKGCLRRHVITPSKLVPADKPLALVTWGCKLLMNHVEENVVKSFIKKRALHAPEGNLAKDGQYKFKLMEAAVVPKGSNYGDKKLCPS